MLTNVQQMVNDSAGIYFPAQRVQNAINEAILEAWQYTKYDLVDVTITMNTGDDIIVIPPTIMIPQYITYNDTKWFIATMADLERWNRQWAGETWSQPKWFIRWGFDHLRVWPRPDQAYDMTMTGLGWPLEEGEGTPDVSNDYNLGIEHLAAATLLQFTRPDLAAIHTQEGKQLLHSYKVTLRNQQSHNIRRWQPANQADFARAGGIYNGKWLRR